MRVEITRPTEADGTQLFRFHFPGEALDIRIARAQLLEQLDIEANRPPEKALRLMLPKRTVMTIHQVGRGMALETFVSINSRLEHSM